MHVTLYLAKSKLVLKILTLYYYTTKAVVVTKCIVMLYFHFLVYSVLLVLHVLFSFGVYKPLV